MQNYDLTPQEQKVENLIVKEGCLTRKQLAEKLFLADCTVGTHLRNIYEKKVLPVNNIAGILWSYYNSQEKNMKNYEKIKQMTPTQLAKLLYLLKINDCGISSFEDCSKCIAYEICRLPTEKAIKNWLSVETQGKGNYEKI